jgi:hypothetical protein
MARGDPGALPADVGTNLELGADRQPAAIGDVAHPVWRASSVGVYRLWRDLGYAIGALLAGLTADAFGVNAAMRLVAALTFARPAVYRRCE